MIERPSIPTIIDSNIFNVDTDKERDIKIIDIDIEDRFPLRVVEVPDVYDDFVSVRQFALELPCMFSQDLHKDVTNYPGYRGSYLCDQTPLWTLINNVLLKHFSEEWGGRFTKPIFFPFVTGIINTKHIQKIAGNKAPLASLLPHTDKMPGLYGYFAGLVYLNLPDECAGGTGFYTSKSVDGQLMYESKMAPNTMVLYQQRIPHSSEIKYKDYLEKFRITQNFFIGDKYYWF
tara:strand:+ start:80 stop:775 length:696 start_codon:yes stop_codon:yes gene_type:complete